MPKNLKESQQSQNSQSSIEFVESNPRPAKHRRIQKGSSASEIKQTNEHIDITGSGSSDSESESSNPSEQSNSSEKANSQASNRAGLFASQAPRLDDFDSESEADTVRLGSSSGEEEEEEDEEILEGQLSTDVIMAINNQLNDESWLARVLNHLRPLSVPITPPPSSLRLEFLKLKKQWGYTRKYEQVDPDLTNCTTCQHQHVATLFKIKNIKTQKKTTTGSNCIKQFSVLNSTTGLFFSRKESLEMINSDINEASEERAEERKAVRKYYY